MRPSAVLAVGLLAAVAATASAEQAMAAEVQVASKIDSVVIYPAGAEITRTAAIRLEPGEHVLVLGDLPQQVVSNSVRIAARASERLDIGSVDTRKRVVLSSDAEQAAAARRQLERERDGLADERAVLSATVQSAETQVQLMRNLASLPTNPGQSGHLASPPVDWSQVFTVIGNRMTEAQRVVIGAQATIREVDRKIQDVEKRLRELQPRQDARTEVKIAVSAPAALEGVMTVRYQIATAGWTPLYDARLQPATKAAAAKLTLARRAAVRQTSSESWDNVQLTLSTAHPAAATTAPVLQPWTVDFFELPASPAPIASGSVVPQARTMARREASADDLRSSAEAAGKASTVEASPVAATVVATPFQALFAIRDRVTVAGSGETKQVFVEEIALDPVLVSRSAPRQDTNAYLYARVTMPRTAPFLAGPVSLFRDQTFVGTGRLPQLVPGEEHEIGFGADDLVKIRHSIADEKRGEQGLIRSSMTDARSFKVTIKSAHERSILFSIQDNLPVSNNKDITVDISARPPPTRRDLDDRRGVVAWEDKLDPDQEKIIEYGWKISWPTGKQITPGR